MWKRNSFIIFACLGLLLSCGKRNDDSVGTSLNSITVKDSVAQSLGTLVDWSVNSVTVLSSTGYLYSVNYDGTLKGATSVYFSNAGCSGTAYLWDYSGIGTAKALGIDLSGVIYAPASPDSDGTLPTGTSTNYNSLTTNVPACSAATGTASVVPTVVITRAAAGIPETITAPLVFED